MEKQSFIIRLRLALLIPGSWKWNAWVRDATAWMERLQARHQFFVRESKTYIKPSLWKYLYYPIAYIKFMRSTKGVPAPKTRVRWMNRADWAND